MQNGNMIFIIKMNKSLNLVLPFPDDLIVISSLWISKPEQLIYLLIKSFRHREQFHLNDYMSRSHKTRDNYQQQQYSNDYHRQIPQESNQKIHNSRVNNFDFKDYNRNVYNKESNPPLRQQKHDSDSPQIDERTFHRRRNFTNSHFQQQQDTSIRNEQRKFDNQLKDNSNLKRYDIKSNLSPRFQSNNNQRKFLTGNFPNLFFSFCSENLGRPKRYSNMRTNQQQGSLSQMQQSNNLEQSNSLNS